MEKQSTQQKQVLEAIRLYGPIRSSELSKVLKVSLKTIYKHLSTLLAQQVIKKTGTTPKVFYAINESLEDTAIVSDKFDQFIEQNYIYVSPAGEMTRGVAGFQLWCLKNKFDFEKEKKIYVRRLQALEKLKKNGLISGKKTILSGKGELFLDNIFFSEFYNLDYFGKTKLGQLVYLGKSSQNSELILEIAKLIKPAIKGLIEKYEIGLICFVPPTIERKVQFLEVLKMGLKLNLSQIFAVKVSTLTKVPQKTLRKLEDRIINAQTTIAVDPNQKINSNILIIDDATGSGATLNEIAKKIRKIAPKETKIIGYSVVGSFKGFDVISEV
jgi:DNA-binding HxlR family transcriptional regulator